MTFEAYEPKKVQATAATGDQQVTCQFVAYWPYLRPSHSIQDLYPRRDSINCHPNVVVINVDGNKQNQRNTM